MLILIMSISIILSDILKKKVEETIPITVMSVTLVVYVFGICGFLKIGAYIVIVFGTLASIYLIIKTIRLIKNKQQKIIMEKITLGMIIYIGMYIIFIIINQKKIFVHHDEFSHWGLLIKNMYLYNDFGTNSNSIVQYNEYPPFTAIFQYLFIALKNEYSETSIITASNILYISIMVVCLKNLSWKNFKKAILYLIIIIFLPLMFFQDFYDNILVDGLLAVFFAYTLYNWYKQKNNRRYKLLTVSLGIVSLSLIKLSGTFLAALIVFIIIGDIIINEKRKKSFIDISIIIIVALIFISSWFVKLNLTKTERKWKIEIESNEIINSSKNEIIKNFSDTMFWKGIFTQRNLTIIEMTCVIFAISMLVGKNIKEKRKYRYYQFSVILSIYIYIIGLGITYCFIIPPEEARQLSSYSRYMGTIILGNLIFFFEIWSDQNRKIDSKKILILTLILMSIFPSETTIQELLNSNNKKRNDLIQRKDSMDIMKYERMLTRDDKIYYFSNVGKSIEKDLLIARYIALPYKITNTNIKIRNEHEFKEILEKENYTYVYLFRITDDFKEKYKNLFKNEVESKTMYRVKKEENDIYLESVELE